MARNPRGPPQQRPQGPPGGAAQAQPAAPAAAPGVDKTQLSSLIAAVEKERNSKVIVYWTTHLAKISEGVAVSLYDQLQAIGKKQPIDLYLFSNGGDAEAPWRIVTLIREYSSRFGVLIPHQARSAATLLALGADEIVMTALATLGPIDPTRTHPLLPTRAGATESEPTSVQDMRYAMQFVREAAGQGSEHTYTSEAWASIFSALFDKIHPLAIGAIEQTYALAKLIAKKCLETHMAGEGAEEKIAQIADSLCDDFKSHTYPIGRVEARELGLKVSDAPETLDAAMMELWKFYVSRPIFPSAQPPPAGSKTAGNIAFLDTPAANFQAVAQYTVEKDGTLKFHGDEWKAY